MSPLWHKADVPRRLLFVRFWGKADIQCSDRVFLLLALPAAVVPHFEFGRHPDHLLLRPFSDELIVISNLPHCGPRPDIADLICDGAGFFSPLLPMLRVLNKGWRVFAHAAIRFLNPHKAARQTLCNVITLR